MKFQDSDMVTFEHFIAKNLELTGYKLDVNEDIYGIESLEIVKNLDGSSHDYPYNYQDLDLSKFYNLKTLTIDDRGLSSIKLPSVLKKIKIINNSITAIIIPKSVTHCELEYNGLKSIKFKKGSILEQLNASNNNLKEISLPNSTEIAYIQENMLEKFNCSKDSKISNLYLNSNMLKTIELDYDLPNIREVSFADNNLNEFICPKNLKELYIQENSLSKLYLNDDLQYISIMDNLGYIDLINKPITWLRSKNGDYNLDDTLSSNAYIEYGREVRHNLDNAIKNGDKKLEYELLVELKEVVKNLELNNIKEIEEIK